MAKYYKKKDGSAWLNFKPTENLNDYVEITEKQWNNHIQSIKNHQPSEPALKRREIAQLKSFLSSTDWIITKIAEETDPEEIASLRSKYASVITERKAARARINELEAELN